MSRERTSTTSKEAPLKSVGIWVRVSTEDQVKGESPEVHEKRARMYAEARGWKVREVYRLEGVSGKAVKEHPEAKRMLHDVKSGRISGLVFSKLARLARSTKELLEFAEDFRAANADLISLHEAIDTGSPAGRLFFTIVAAMAQWEREEIAERVAASVPIRAKLGKPIGGAAPFGYRWHEKKLVPDSKEAPIRALLYELFIEHRRKKKVARLLNERGYRTRKGALFTDTTVDRLLRDTTAKGIYRQNYTKTSDRTRRWELKPESEWVETPVEPIVSEELWSRANAILAEQRAKLKKPARTNVHLFTGYAFCSCGSKMYVWKASPKYICPKCRNKVPIADLEAIYRDQLSAFLLSKDEVAKHLQAANDALQEKEALIAAGEAELAKLEAEAERVYQLYLADSLSVEDFGRRHQPLADRRKQLDDELPRLRAQCDVMKIAALAGEAAAFEAHDLAAHWDTFSPGEKRQLVETITDRIVIGKEEVAVNLLYLPVPGTTSPKATRPHDRVAFPLPGVRLSLTAPLPKPYPEAPKTLADHLLKARHLRGWTQREAAQSMGSPVFTYSDWETGTHEPSVRFYPAIIAFLGYDPHPTPTTLPERLAAKRRALGLTIKEAAARVGVDEGTFARWESGEWTSRSSHERVSAFLAGRG